MGGNTYVFREDYNRHIDNGKYFSDLYPTFRKSEFWKEWLKYALACLRTGKRYLTEILTVISDALHRTGTNSF